MKLVKVMFLCLMAFSMAACFVESEKENEGSDGPFVATAELYKSSSDAGHIYSRIRFTGEGSESVACQSASLSQNGVVRSLLITGSFSSGSHERMCFLPNLQVPSELDSSITIRLSIASGAPFTLQFSDLPAVTQEVTNNTIYRYEQGRMMASGRIVSPKPFSPAKFDFSGGSSSLSYVIEQRLGLAYSEREIMEGLLEHGESERIVERRGFSLLDMKKFVTAIGYQAGGFIADDTDFDDFGDSIPFMTPMNFNGLKTFVTVVSMSSTVMQVIHPHFGYVEVPVHNGRFDTMAEDQFIVFIVFPTRADEAVSKKSFAPLAFNDI